MNTVVIRVIIVIVCIASEILLLKKGSHCGWMDDWFLDVVVVAVAVSRVPENKKNKLQEPFFFFFLNLKLYLFFLQVFSSVTLRFSFRKQHKTTTRQLCPRIMSLSLILSVQFRRPRCKRMAMK